jgi:hypothetical protein
MTTAASSSSGIRHRTKKPTIIAGAFAVLAVLLVMAIALLGIPAHQDELASFGQDVATAMPLAILGFLIVRREPRNKVAWLMLSAAVGLLLTNVASLYTLLTYRLGYHLPFGAAALLIGYSWIAQTAAITVAILLFPDGHVPSPRWRWALGMAIIAATCYQGVTYGAAVSAIASHNVRADSTGGISAVDNPAGWLAGADDAAIAVLVGCLLSFVVAQVLTWRRADSERRQQLKWLLSGAVAFLVSGIITLPIGAVDPTPSATVTAIVTVVSDLGWVALPVGMGVAILRYRLYDIDRIISRTLAYSIVTAVLAGLYAGLVLLATGVLDLTSQVAVAAATLAAAALFNPLRRRVQRLVDRRFHRARYDADNTVAAFAARLQDAIEPDAVRSDLVGTVHRALEPAHVSLWLAGGQR